MRHAHTVAPSTRLVLLLPSRRFLLGRLGKRQDDRTSTALLVLRQLIVLAKLLDNVLGRRQGAAQVLDQVLVQPLTAIVGGKVAAVAVQDGGKRRVLLGPVK